MEQVADEIDGALSRSGLKERIYKLSSIKRVPSLDDLR